MLPSFDLKISCQERSGRLSVGIAVGIAVGTVPCGLDTMRRGLEDNLELGWSQGIALAMAMIWFYLNGLFD